MGEPDSKPKTSGIFSVEDDASLNIFTLRELLQYNVDDDDLCAWLQCADVGESYFAGGGAAPAVTVERLS